MPQVNLHLMREKFKSWFHPGGPADIWFRTGFVFGVPIGIAVGAVAGAIIEITGGNHSAAWGVLIGVGAAIFSGVLIGATRVRRYGFRRWEGTFSERGKLDEALNIAAAAHRYAMIRKEDGYIVYGPLMTLPVAAGPLTMSNQYLLVMVQISDTKVTLIGPRWILSRLADAAAASGVTAIPLDEPGEPAVG